MMYKRRSCMLLFGLLTMPLLIGCGSRMNQVEGKVVFKGSTTPARELAGYQVMFESTEQKVSANGVVQSDGTFRVGTEKDNDGAILGKHRVALSPPSEEEGKPRPKKLIPDRYGSFDTSQLEVVIKPGTNQVTLEVEGLNRK